MKCLVSTTKAVLLYDHVTGISRVLHENAGLYYGISWSKDYLYLASRPGVGERDGAKIHIFDRSLVHLRDVVLPQVSDLHQMVCHNDELWVASSGHDCFWVYDIETFSPKFMFSPIPSASVGVADSHHFNSILISGGLIYTLAHNWHQRSFVCVHDYKTREFVDRFDNLGSESHNIWLSERDGLTVLNSGNSTLTATQRKNFARLSEQGAVFPRGLAVTSDAIVIGLSPFESDPTKRVSGVSQLALCNKEFTEIAVLQLGDYGSVYEVRALDEEDKCHSSTVFTPLNF